MQNTICLSRSNERNFFFCWVSSCNHCLAALDLGAGVEQPFGCLIVQNRQAVQSMRRSMDWTLEDNMVDGLFFCSTLTGHRGGHTPLVQAGAETSNTGAEAVKPDPGRSWEDYSGRWVPVSGMKVRGLVGLSARSALHWLSAHCVARMLLLSDELMRCCAACRPLTVISSLTQAQTCFSRKRPHTASFYKKS